MSDPRDRLEVYPDRDSWLAARKSGVGGSDAAAILGLSRWASPLSVWMKKVGLDEETTENEAMKWGSLLEPLVIAQAAEETGLAIEHCDNAILRHPTHEGLFCSPDGFAGDGTLVEAKTTNGFNASDWDEGPPPHYMAQVQHSLFCCPEAPRALIAVLIGGQVFRWCWIERDETWGETHLPALLDFVRRIREEDPPPVTDHDADDKAITAYFKKEIAGLYEPLPVEALDIHEELQQVKAEKKALEARERGLKTRLKEMIGVAEVGILPGQMGVYRWSTRERAAHMVKASSWRQLDYLKKLKE